MSVLSHVVFALYMLESDCLPPCTFVCALYSVLSLIDGFVL